MRHCARSRSSISLSKRRPPDEEAAAAVCSVNADALVPHRVLRLAAVSHDFQRGDGLAQFVHEPAGRVDCASKQGVQRAMGAVNRPQGTLPAGGKGQWAPAPPSPTCFGLRHPAQPEGFRQACGRLVLPCKAMACLRAERERQTRQSKPSPSRLPKLVGLNPAALTSQLQLEVRVFRRQPARSGRGDRQPSLVECRGM